MDANVRIPPSQPDGHDDPPQDSPQDTELEDTNWVYRLFIPEVTEQEAMCFANIGTDSVNNPYLALFPDPGIFLEHPARTRQSAPGMIPKHKKARCLICTLGHCSRAKTSRLRTTHHTHGSAGSVRVENIQQHYLG